MNLRIVVLGWELLHITTDNQLSDEVDTIDGSGYTAATPTGFTPSQATGWDIKLHEPEWGE